MSRTPSNTSALCVCVYTLKKKKRRKYCVLVDFQVHQHLAAFNMFLHTFNTYIVYMHNINAGNWQKSKREHCSIRCEPFLY